MAKLSEERKNELEQLYQRYLNDPLVMQMKDIPIHRGSNCYIHVFKVCKLVIKKAVKKNKEYNYEALIIGAILHDYYLYDWRADIKLRKKHCRKHPLIAASNAKRDFDVSEEVMEIIKTHMWPITIHLYPKTKEAKLVNEVDDIIATKEVLSSKKHKIKTKERDLQFISRLFD